MKLHYHPDTDRLYVELKAGPGAETLEVDDGLNVDLVRLFRFCRARFQIEFAFRDARQHLGLQDCRARSQARLDFHFNVVFAALFRARLQARLRADGPLGPFSLHPIKQRNFEVEIHKRCAARSAPGRHAAHGEALRRRPRRCLWRPPPPLETEPAGPLTRPPSQARTTFRTSKSVRTIGFATVLSSMMCPRPT